MGTAQELVTSHVYLIQHVLNSLAARYPRHVDRAELWSAGALGLVDAAQRFDDAVGVPFVRYATIRIRGAMIDSTRTRDWSTRGLRRGMRDLRSAAEGFAEAEGRAPSVAELAALVGLTVAEVEQRRAAAAAATLLHLDQQLDDATDEATLADRLEESTPEWLPGDAAEQRELLGTLRTAVRFLPPVQRAVIERSYFGDETLAQIAESLGVSEGRVSQVRSEAMTALRSYFGDAYEGVPPVPEGSPGVRQRQAYLATMQNESTWRSRFDAAGDVPPLSAHAG